MLLDGIIMILLLLLLLLSADYLWPGQPFRTGEHYIDTTRYHLHRAISQERLTARVPDRNPLR